MEFELLFALLLINKHHGQRHAVRTFKYPYVLDKDNLFTHTPFNLHTGLQR